MLPLPAFVPGGFMCSSKRFGAVPGGFDQDKWAAQRAALAPELRVTAWLF